MNNKTNIFIVLLGLIALVWGVWSFICPDDEDVVNVAENGAHWQKTGVRDGDETGSRAVSRSKKNRKLREVFIDEDIEEVKVRRERIVPDDADERELSKLQKSILKELREALANNNLKRVRKAIALFHAPKSEGGLEGNVPKVMRQQAVSALGWFGASGISDMVEFMADVDPDIEQDAFSQFELALDDWEMGDRERSAILITALKAIHDTEQIDSLLMNLNNMRNSVKADTIVSIVNSGSAEARVMMQEQVGIFTDADVETVADVTKWKQDNADDPFDEEFYGPQKNDD